MKKKKPADASIPTLAHAAQEMSSPPSPPSYVDITPFLRRLGAELVPGEMVTSERFDLFEAMSALELMDRRMDSGLEDFRTASVAEQLASGELPLELSSTQVVGICEELLMAEIACLEGHSFAQTVFGCLYAHPAARAELLRVGYGRERSDATASPLSSALVPPVGWEVEADTAEARSQTHALLVCATCTLLLRTLSLVRQAVLSADVFEDEDFNPQLYDLDICNDLAHDDVLAIAQCVRARLLSRAARLSPDGDGGAASVSTMSTSTGSSSSSSRKKKRKGKKGKGKAKAKAAAAAKEAAAREAAAAEAEAAAAAAATAKGAPKAVDEAVVCAELIEWLRLRVELYNIQVEFARPGCTGVARASAASAAGLVAVEVLLAAAAADEDRAVRLSVLDENGSCR